MHPNQVKEEYYNKLGKQTWPASNKIVLQAVANHDVVHQSNSNIFNQLIETISVKNIKIT